MANIPEYIIDEESQDRAIDTEVHEKDELYGSGGLIDLTDSAPSSYKIRAPHKVTGIVLHQTGVDYELTSNQIKQAQGDRHLALYKRVRKINAHVVILHGHAAQIKVNRGCLLHNVLEHLPSSHNLSGRSISVEIEGNYPFKMTDAKAFEAFVNSARRALKEVVTLARQEGMPIKYIWAHRQSTVKRPRDPGEELWKLLVEDYAIPTLGLQAPVHETYGGGGFTIPDKWQDDIRVPFRVYDPEYPSYESSHTPVKLVEMRKDEGKLIPYKDFFPFKDGKNAPITSEKGFFVMDGHLLNAMRKASSIDLAMTDSYIKIFYYDKDNKRNKTINVDLIKNPEFDAANLLENEGRPQVALMGVDISVSPNSSQRLTSNIDLKFKVYDKSALDPGGVLYPFFFSAFPFGIEYGLVYNGESEDRTLNKLLNWRELRMCNAYSFDLTIDEKGIFDFTIHSSTGANHAFNRMYLGSHALKESGLIRDNYTLAYEQLKAVRSALSEVETKAVNEAGISKKKAKKISASLKTIEKKYEKNTIGTRKIFGNYLANRLKELSTYAIKHPYYTGNKKQKKKEWVYLRDALRILALDDLSESLLLYATKDHMTPAIVWSRFNEKCGDFAGQSMDRFLIPLEDLKHKLSDQADVVNQPGVQLDAFISILMGYLNDQTAYKTNNKGQDLYNGFVRCDPVYFIEQDIQGDVEYLQIVFADRKRGIEFVENFAQIKDPHDEQVEKLDGEGEPPAPAPMSRGEKLQHLKDTNVAYLRTLEAGAFVKSIRMSAETDPYLINMNFNKMYGYRSIMSDLDHETVPIAKHETQGHTDKIRMPLRGTIELVGHPSWKPMKSIYLFLGSEEFDGWYQIQSVTHSYSIGLPTTSIEVFFKGYH